MTAAAPASAQPVDLPIPPATTTEYAAGIRVAEAVDQPVYTAKDGRTLYGLDMRTLQRWSPDPAMFCKTGCDDWEPILAPADAEPNIVYPGGFGSSRRAAQAKLAEEGFITNPQKAPDWTVIEGPFGPHWVYKGWHMVFVRKDDKRGSTEFDGADEFRWNTLKFIPPVPELVAPPNVASAFLDGAYALTDNNDRLLYTGKCRNGCSDWRPLHAGMASLGIGNWKVSTDGDLPQWAYRGKPVFVSDSGDAVPDGGTILRP